MSIRIEILQALVDNVGEYLLVERHIEFHNSDDTWEALLIAPDVPRDMYGKKIDDLPYKEVARFADQEIKTTIHLGKHYSPFQYGIRNKDFTRFEKMECRPMDLVARCYEGGISDYNEARSLMESLKTEEKK